MNSTAPKDKDTSPILPGTVRPSVAVEPDYTSEFPHPSGKGILLRDMVIITKAEREAAELARKERDPSERRRRVGR